MADLQTRFFQQLTKKYGEWDKNSARFGKHPYGKIADDLSMGGSQFSKLLYGTATNGMYERTIKNIERLIEKDQLKQNNQQLTLEVSNLKKELTTSSNSKSFVYKYLILATLLASSFGYFIGKTFQKEDLPEVDKKSLSKHFLSDFFEREFNSPHVSPFVSSGEVQSFCPCSAFEGTWELAKEYTIPVPVGKPGLYYVAKHSDMKIRCTRNVPPDKMGLHLMGFEQMKHELWLDVNRESISPKYFDLQTKNYTKDFYNINFEENASFQKIADIRSFMFNNFEISGNEIVRKAEPAGRYATNVDEDLCQKHEIDVQDALENIIGNMVKTVCMPSINNFCNPNQLIENESQISFNCDFTIAYENLGIGGSYPYTKSIILREQHYSDNLLCSCEEF